MDYSDNSLAKRILAIFLAFVAVVGVSAATSYTVSRSQAKKIQKTLVTTIKGDLGDYLADYTVTQRGNSGSITPGMEEELQLTQEQIDAIVDSVTSTIEYSLIKDTISKYSSVSEESLAALKSKMDSEISKVLDSNDTTKDMTKEEKESIINTVSTIVKYDMLDILKEYEKTNSQDIQLLRESMSKDISSLQASISEYEKKFMTLEGKLEQLTKDLQNTGNSKEVSAEIEKTKEEITKEIAKVTEEYKDLLVEITNINKSIEHLESMDFTEDIKDLKAATDKNKQDINTLASLLNKQFSMLNNDLDALGASLGTKINNTIAGMENYINDQTEDSKKALLDQLELAKEALNQEMANASQDQKDKLQAMLDKISAAENNINNTDVKVDDLKNTSNALKDDFNAYKDALTALKGDLKGLEETLKNTKDKLANLSQDLSQNKDQIANQLTNTKAELENAITNMTLTNEQKKEINLLLEVINNSITNLDDQTAEDLADLADRITQTTTGLQGGLNDLENTLNDTQQALTELGGKVSGNKQEIQDQLNTTKETLENAMNSMELTKQQKDQIDALLSVIEGNLDNANDSIGDLTGKISNTNQQIAQTEQTLRSEIDKVEGDIADIDANLQQLEQTLQSSLSQVRDGIEEAKQNATQGIDSAKAEITGNLNAMSTDLNGKISANTQSINNLRTEITNNNQTINTTLQQLGRDIEQINNILKKQGNSGVAKITYDSSTNTLTITELDPSASN